jgi:acetyl-CoA acetyltransferase
MTNDVAIIGVGLHPFGRFEGKSAMEMGVDAIFSAVADAGVEWKDIQFATGGSWTVANPDAIVGMVGLSGIPFTNVFNACATAASAAKACADGIRLGDYDIGIAIGLDKHPRGAFTEDPALAELVRRERAVPHHPVLRNEGKPLPTRPRHLAGHTGQGRGQKLP